MGESRLIASQNSPEVVPSVVCGFILGRDVWENQVDSVGTELSRGHALAYFFLGAFLLQRLELPVLVFVDEYPAALDVRHCLVKQKMRSEVNRGAPMKQSRAGKGSGVGSGGGTLKAFHVNSVGSANNYTETCTNARAKTLLNFPWFVFNPLQIFPFFLISLAGL